MELIIAPPRNASVSLTLYNLYICTGTAQELEHVATIKCTVCIATVVGTARVSFQITRSTTEPCAHICSGAEISVPPYLEQGLWRPSRPPGSPRRRFSSWSSLRHLTSEWNAKIAVYTTTDAAIYDVYINSIRIYSDSTLLLISDAS